jgi:ABC-type dipeptide/oligopeptide/nickel transport system ATPase subunit
VDADGLNDTALATCDAASMPLPPRAAFRPDLIEDLHRTLVATGALWLHGSSGLGKTTVALLLV